MTEPIIDPQCGVPALPPVMPASGVSRSHIPYECSGRQGGLFWRTAVWVIRRGHLFSVDAAAANRKRARSFGRYAIAYGFIGITAYAITAGAVMSASSPSSTALLHYAGVGAAMGLLSTFFLTLMMRIVGWFACPKWIPADRQRQALARSDYLSAPLVLLLLLVFSPVALAFDSHDRPMWIAGFGVAMGAIILYWLSVVLAGVADLTGRHGRMMLWPGVKLTLAWLVVLVVYVSLPITVLMWVLLVGTR